MTKDLKKRVNRKFTHEFRKEAVDQVIAQGRSVTEVADALGVPAGTLSVWVSKFRNGQWTLDSGLSNGTNRTNQPTMDQRKISELQAQLRRVTQERDILKKAAAYFAQSLG
jgi:transposase